MLALFINMLNNDEEKDKLTAIYEKYYGTMLGVAKSILADHALAEDAVSKSIIDIIDNLHKINDVSCHKTRAYIVIIVRNNAIDLLRKQKNHPEQSIDDMELSDNSALLAENLTMQESYNIIVKHILALPKLLSDVLYLSAVMNYSNKEIALELKISNDTVRQRLSRAKAQVKITLAKEGIKYEGK